MEQERKKKVLFMSDYCGAKTGFGGFMREILFYLYKTGKYELYLYGQGMTWTNPDFARWPWKVYGTLPDSQHERNNLAKERDAVQRLWSYGEPQLDRIIKEVKPDIFIGCQDSWGVDFAKDKAWWEHISKMVQVTIDSRPLLRTAVELARQTEHFYCWADFATKEFHKIGQDHVKTLRGSVNTNVFKKLDNDKKRELRIKHKIPLDAFCVGMLSRNQLRKSFPALLLGYKEFKKQNPHIKNTRCLLFTSFSEGHGWDLQEEIKKAEVNPDEVLACYKDRATGDYEVRPFKGEGLTNPASGVKRSLVTVHPHNGLTDEQVCEWYNLLDVYVHAFTSGGQERSIQEAKLCELVTLVTNYSCGEDACQPEAASLPLDYNEYVELTGTAFEKAWTRSISIARQLKKFHELPRNKKEEWGRKGRQWVFDNFSIEVIGKQYEEIFDAMPLTDYDFDFKYEPKNPAAEIPENDDDNDWVKSLYKLILNRDVYDDDRGLQDWLVSLNNNITREAILGFFRQEAKRMNDANIPPIKLETLLGDEKPQERVLITMPQSLGDCIMLTALLRDARELYHDKKIYVATKPPFMSVFQPLIGEFIDYVIEWRPEMDQQFIMEGYAGNPELFHICLYPHFPTQHLTNYVNHGDTRHKFNLKYEES